MQHELFHSDFKPLIERSSLLDIIRDSPLGENPHRAVAMRLIFKRMIHDCQERMLVQAEKSSQVDLVAESDNSGEATSTLTAATHPTTGESSPPAKRSKPTVTEPPQSQAVGQEALQTRLRVLEARMHSSTPKPNPLLQLSQSPQAQLPHPQVRVPILPVHQFHLNHC